MSRATITTGNITFNVAKKTPAQIQDDAPMHIAILGDFSGRTSRGANDWQHIVSRRASSVDRDNFEEIFEKLNVTLELPVADKPIHFTDFDDLHPDYLYKNVALFDELRTLKRKLRNPQSYDQAIKEIQQWAGYRQQSNENTAPPATQSEPPAPDNLLDAILVKNQQAGHFADSPAGNINQLIKDIVAPYVTTKSDPRLAEYETAVDDATAELMRKIMHASHFQALEASWRSLYMLVRRIETDSRLKIFLIDVSKEELISDIQACGNDLRESGIYKLMVEQSEIAGRVPYSVINADYFIEDRPDDLLLASALSNIGLAISTSVIAGGSMRFAGVETLESNNDPNDWDFTVEEGVQLQWAALREQPSAVHLALAAPRFLIRLPYGRKTSPIESFDFEELSELYPHEYYLWGNSAWLVTLLLAQNYSEIGWKSPSGRVQHVTDLPVHVYSVDNENTVKPPAEVLTTDRMAVRMIEAGFLPVRSVNNSTSILIAEILSVTGKTLRGHWQ